MLANHRCFVCMHSLRAISAARECPSYVPWICTAVAVAYGIYVTRKLNQCPRSGKINPGVQKDKPKVVDTVEIEDLGNQTVFCRCWRSAKVKRPPPTRSDTCMYRQQSQEAVFINLIDYLPPSLPSRSSSRIVMAATTSITMQLATILVH